ncbi:MAG: NADPH-dependent 7-cyano-7-deazaguanine reductase QueF [Rhodocyclaceae bacterium]|nr:NADPH-dependent 7-cyano-7-deazaguanine reductase QueF [Rhodocyclaceae bacterium]
MNDAPSVGDSPLGRAVAYASHYSPELLFPIPRQEKRAELGLCPEALPFVGFDLWNAYELSWLNPKGKPVAALGRFRFPADTPRLVESKSLKLYLNSFNQSRFVKAADVAAAIARDLSAAAGGTVEVRIVTLDRRPQRSLGYPDGILLDTLDIEADQYNPDPALLSAAGPEVSETLYSHLLKSNCLVTGQPDWAMVVVRYVGPAITREGLLKYFISFRQHNEFHEQCVERIFCDVMARCRPKSLAVWARYTRRGGLDINPFRSTGDTPEPDNTGEVRQ